MAGWLVFASSVNAHPGLPHDIERATQLLDPDPDNVPLLLQRARLHRLNKDVAAASRDLNSVAKLVGERADVSLERGLCFTLLGDHKQAEKHLSRYMTRGEPSALAFSKRAHARAALNRTTEAIDDYTKSLSMQPNVEIYIELGCLLEQTDQLAEAAGVYREGLERLGGAINLRVLLIEAESKLGHHASALDLIHAIMPRARVKTQWLLLEGGVYQRMGDSEKATVTWHAAIKEADRIVARRRTAMNLTLRAQVNVKLGQSELARSDYEAALRLAPEYAPAREGLRALQTPANALKTSVISNDGKGKQ